MAWRQREVDEVTAAIEKHQRERSATGIRRSKGELTRDKSLGLEKLLKKLEEKAQAAPESLPEPPWEDNVDGLFYCDCGKCDGRGRIFHETKGVRFCEESQIKGRTHIAEDVPDLGLIFDK